MTRVAIALGSNLGDRLEFLRLGAAGVSEMGSITGVSRLYETEPIGGPEQGRYLNAVILVETEAPPLDVLAHLLSIELRARRSRDVRWGPRTLDLDLIIYGSEQIDLPNLEVPHPRAHARGFVLAPLSDVWPDAVLADGRTVAVALGALGTHGLLAWTGDWRRETPSMGWRATAWVAAQLVLFLGWLVALIVTYDQPAPTFLIGGGVALAAAGLLVLDLSRRALGAELTPYPQPRQGARLVDSGVYSVVRHPIYLGVLMLFGGIAVAAGSIAAGAIVALLTVFFAAKSSVEERALAIGISGYDDYRRDVTSRFVPYLF